MKKFPETISQTVESGHWWQQEQRK